ncbi:MAG: NADH-quinone oxidoreductase subunit N [Planctomycetota bacterium]
MQGSVLAQYAQDLGYIWPEIILSVTVLLALIADLVLGGRDVRITGLICLIGTAFASWYLFRKLSPENLPGRPFGLMIVDQTAVFLKIITAAGLAAILLFSLFFRGFQKDGIGEYYAILVAATLGVFFLVSTNNLLLFYVSVELLSLSSYVMAGFNKADRRSGEAALKYLVYGALSTAILLYGFSILYGLTGSLDMETVGAGLKAAMTGESVATSQAISVAAILVVAGLGYKLASFPFHFWAPDVYEGAPTPVTTFLAVISKAGAFGVVLRLMQLTFLGGSGGANPEWALRFSTTIAIVAAAGMTYGNITAMLQDNAKRMLAYSSIAHVGYLLMAFAAMGAAAGRAEASAEPASALLFYLAAYYLMNLGAFGVVIYLSDRYGVESIPEYRGLGWRSPIAGATMVVFLLSLTGLPPTVGFVGKYLLFVTAFKNDLAWLAVVAALNSVISLFYYFRFAKALYLRSESDTSPLPALQGVPTYATLAVLVVLGAATVSFGLMFNGLGTAAQAAAAASF